MYQRNWPLALERFLIMEGLSMQTLMANITSFSPWPEQHEVGSGAILPCNYIIIPLPSTYDQKLSLLRHNIFITKAESASRAMSHKNMYGTPMLSYA